MLSSWIHALLPNTLVKKVRALFAIALLLGATFFIFALIDASNMHKNWTETRFNFIDNSVQEWLLSYQDELHYTHLAMKPRKANIADLIEDDNNRALQVLLDEVREFHGLDFIFLEIESETLMDHTGELTPERKAKTLPLLQTEHKAPFLKAYNQKEMTVLRGELSNGSLATSLKIPIYYDAGDIAAYLTIIKMVTPQASQKREWMSSLSQFEFVLPQERKQNISVDLIDSLFLVRVNTIELPVICSLSKKLMGYFYLSEPNHEVRTTVYKNLFFSLLPLALLTIVLWFIYRFIQRSGIGPISQISDVAESFTAGDVFKRTDFMDKKHKSGWTEVDSLGEGFNHLLDVLENRQDKLESLNASLESQVLKRTQDLTKANIALNDLALSDALTGVGNRHAFDEAWAKLTDQFVSGKVTTAAVAIVDCDFFKSINDDYGHHVGDKVLVTVARLIKKQLDETTPLVRLGGDEFAILFSDVESEVVVEKMETLWADVKSLDVSRIGVKEQLSVSVGISATSDHRDIKVFELMKQADTSMYIAKQSFSNKVVLYKPELHASTEEGLSHENTVVVLNAIEKGSGLTLFYQPVYKKSSAQVDYFEVLSRIDVGEGFMSPATFLPIVHRTKKAVEFDQAVIYKILSALRSGVIESGTGLSFNLSAESLVSEKICEWFKPLVPYLEKHKIIVEITETTLIKQLGEVSTDISDLRKAGFTVALDDFGSGYSSISYLAHLPVDIIKLDRSLANVVCENNPSAKLILGLVEELSEIGYQIVIEGVENQEMFDVLSDTYASHLQGYYINRPAAIPSNNISHISKTY